MYDHLHAYMQLKRARLQSLYCHFSVQMCEPALVVKKYSTLLEIRCYSAPFWGAHINVYILLPYRVLATPLYIERVLINTPGVVIIGLRHTPMVLVQLSYKV